VHVAIVSDIHANRHAFEAVLADARSLGVDEVWCLGDLVGYGGEPDACVELAAEHVAVCLAGNHDLAVTGELPMDEFSRGAGISARWTQGVIAPDNLAYLRELRPAGVEGDFGLYHASPRDPVWEYVLSDILADRCFDEADQRVCFIGHSHVALAFTREDADPGRVPRTTGALREPGNTADVRDRRWLLNPGSVGQPRDGDPRAAWIHLDTQGGRVEWRRTTYDIAGASAAIRAAGLPDSLAERLGYGQ
jgi:diadenosine tetraphosphatase ApaH/serine/threonine PP2A family protein phosphatase